MKWLRLTVIPFNIESVGSALAFHKEGVVRPHLLFAVLCRPKAV